jgi:hypothetical protein
MYLKPLMSFERKDFLFLYFLATKQYLFLFVFGDRVLVSSPGWTGTCDPTASASRVLELQACIPSPALSTAYKHHMYF